MRHFVIAKLSQAAEKFFSQIVLPSAPGCLLIFNPCLLINSPIILVKLICQYLAAHSPLAMMNFEERVTEVGREIVPPFPQ